MNKKGISLVEIVVASVIFAVLTLGLANLFIAARRYILHSQKRMAGVEALKGFLNQFPQNVREDAVDSCPNANCTQASETINFYGNTYSADCQFSGLPGLDARKSICTITWNETYF